MIIHLLKTDWQRLRWPILGLWLLAFLSALPWLFYTPESFTAPWWDRSGWSGRLPNSITGRQHSTPAVSTEFVHLAAIGLATAIGMLGVRWQGAMPLGKGKAATAKLLSLLAFIVLPQLLIGITLMLVLKFPFETALSTGLGTSLSLLITLAVAAAFGRLCRSGWAWLAAVVIFLGLVHVFNEVTPGRNLDLDVFVSEKGPRLWALGTLAFAGIMFLPKILRSRPGQPSAIAAGVLSLLVSMIATRHLPQTALMPSRPHFEASQLNEIGATIRAGYVTIHDQTRSGNSDAILVSAGPSTTGTRPSGTSVVWTRDSLFSRSRGSTSGLPTTNSPAALDALEGLLPAPLAPRSHGMRDSDGAVGLTVKRDELDQDTELSVDLQGLVFRYEKLADFPISENYTQRHGTFALAARKIPDPKKILIDLLIQGPAKGISIDPTQLTEPEEGAETFRVILFAPSSGVCLQLTQSLKQSSLAPGGARVVRRILTPENLRVLETLDTSDLRVLIYRPVVLAQIHRTVRFKPLEARYEIANRDWQVNRNHRLGLPAYLENHRPRRPDPIRVSTEAFSAYLRDVCAVWPEDIASRDLAEFAPRFGELIALHAERYPAAKAVELGVPDSQRSEIIGAVHSNLGNPASLAYVIGKRGWQRDAKATLVKALQAHTELNSRDERSQSILVGTLATLEEPDTYPLLLKSLENTNSKTIYDTIRELPGIDQGLEETINRISATLSPDQGYEEIIERRLYDVFDPYQACIAHGNQEALEKLLQRWQLIPKQGLFPKSLTKITDLLEAVPTIPGTNEAWDAFLSGKTAADFTHDPLTGKFRASSASE